MDSYAEIRKGKETVSTIAIREGDIVIPVCLSCYQAVMQLKMGMSDWIRRARCRVCKRIFVLDLKTKKEEG